MDREIAIRFENVERRIDVVEKSQGKCLEDMWKEINELKKSHNGHDLVIQKLALIIEQMGKDLSKSVQELSKSLGDHLTEEENERKETIQELKNLGWRVLTGVITSAVIGFGGIIWAIISRTPVTP